MNKEELVDHINECITEECGIEVFLGLKNNELRKANFLADTQQDIKRMFISELQDKIIETDSSVINFSEADERRNTIYQYDLAYIIHSGFISGYQNRYGDNLKPPTNVYHRMTA